MLDRHVDLDLGDSTAHQCEGRRVAQALASLTYEGLWAVGVTAWELEDLGRIPVVDRASKRGLQAVEMLTFIRLRCLKGAFGKLANVGF